MYQRWSVGLFTTSVANEEDRKDLSWKAFFCDPSKWWDNRYSKQSPMQLDFKHKVFKEPLWMHSRDNGSWVRDSRLVSSGLAPKHQRIETLDIADTLALISACCKNKDLLRGTQIHNELQKMGLVDGKYADALVTMYAKCGEIQKAQALLDIHDSRNVVPWTALIASYVRDGKGQTALDCFEKMQCNSILPNDVTYLCVLKACAAIGAIEKGKKVHDDISRQGLLGYYPLLGNALVNMYAKCGALHQARSVLEQLPSRSVFSWSALIDGYAQNGQGQEALECFEQMQCEGIHPNEVTFVGVLKACAAIRALEKGEKIHDEILRRRLLEHHIVLGGALVDMYAKCGALRKAQSVLENLPSRNVVTWNALIAGFVQKGQGQQSLECFEEMQHEGILPNDVTYLCILKACTAIGAIDKGKKIHDEIARQGMLEHNMALGGALVDMYAKCGALHLAQRVLQVLPSRNTVSWNALISNYAQNGQCQQALDCFREMQHEGILPDASIWNALIGGYVQNEQSQQALDCFEQMSQAGILPNEVTYASVLKACAAIGAIDKGKEFHDEISRQGLLERFIVLGSALVDMYAKCGALHQAQSVLEKLPSRNVVCWSALIAGYAQSGQCEQALDCFEQMQREGILPDEVTLCSLLNLCSHLGLVKKGQELFDNMEASYGLKPSIAAFTCMVDLLGRAGHLLKAVEIIQGMPFPANFEIWHCLLGACKKWVNVIVGTWAFEQAVELDKCNGATYILMGNIYAAAGMTEKAKDIEAMRIKNKAWSFPGCSSWTDLINEVHEFCVSDTKHAQSKNIDAKLDVIAH